MMTVHDFSLTALSQQYREKTLSPVDMVTELYATIRRCSDTAIWTTLLDEATCLAAAQALQNQPGATGLPLYGIPFSVKDNVDVAGINTGCSCIGYERMPTTTATTVQKALDAGAILIGKNSLDQFATGLSGTRVMQPHCLNPFDPDVIPGGSSSGSGVAVARGLVSFSIGTDTGGSGRIPAAMNNVVGIKPTLGTLSDQGVVHNSRFLDTLSVFSQTVTEGQWIYRALLDPAATVNRLNASETEQTNSPTDPTRFVFGTPDSRQLEFYGDTDAEKAFDDAVETLQAMGGEHRPIDFTPFADAGTLPFDSGLLAERHFNFGEIAQTCPDAVHPALLSTLEKAAGYSRDDLIRAIYQMKDVRAEAHRHLEGLDCLVVPTVAKSFTCNELRESPVTNNHKVGHYTYFVNPMNLCAVAVPATIKPDGVPFGITLVGRPGNDTAIQELATRFQTRVGLPPGTDARSTD